MVIPIVNFPVYLLMNLMNIPIVNLPFPLPINSWLSTENNQSFTACLHIDGKVNSDFSEGVNSTRLQLKGRLVQSTLPSSVDVDCRLSIKMINPFDNKEMFGVMIVKKILQSQWKEVNSFYGAIIEGEFIPTTNQEDVNPFGDV
jgi:hypothetical protein